MTVAPTTEEERMAKKQEPKVPFYAKIRASLRARFERVAEDNGRKLNAELERAMEAHCRQHEDAKLAAAEEDE